VKILLLTKARGLGELILRNGFIKLLGKSNVYSSEDIPNKLSLDDYDLILIFRDFVISNLPYVKYVLNHGTKIAFIDVYDDPLIHKLFFHPKILKENSITYHSIIINFY
jgi:hypothetical protein